MNILLKKLVIFAAALAFSFSALGQGNDIITIYGHVADNRTSESLFYSSVSLSGTNITNVSNADGMFSLKIPAALANGAEITVSHLGYSTRAVPVSSFEGSSSDKPLEIVLNPIAIQLDPVTVRSIDPVILFRSAFYKVKDNFPGSRVGMTAFYREMIKKGTAKYLVLNEAVIDIDKSSYTGIQGDRVGIYKGRGSTNYDTSDTLFIKLQGGISTALQLDMAREPFLGCTIEEAPRYFNFSMGGVESYDGYSFYVLDFEPNDNVKEILFRGKLYIEVESLAIGRAEFSMAVEGREEEAATLFVLKRPAGTKFYVNKADYIISYKCLDGKWYYDYCRGDVVFNTRKNRSPFKSTFSVTEEMAVTDHKEGGLAIEPAGRIKFKDILSDKVADFIDDGFWEDYNIIEPDQSIDVLIKKIVRQLNRRE
ncbi:MAG: carboxypeptidase-like regulatory domain-containing protein [Bacteroidia bacterium]|nr:carboxypeptidase-like regulatory domain-containing protein [Bacteroidia bacterium]